MAAGPTRSIDPEPHSPRLAIRIGCSYTLHFMPIYLTRHASAGTRGSLGHNSDLDRTLDAVGHEQAEGIVNLLGDVGVTAIYTSRAARCRQTIEPLGQKLDVEVVQHDALLEGQSATAAVHLARTLAQSDITAALCSHGDIIPDMIQTLAREGTVIVGPRAWAKGSTWELRTRGGDITEAEFLGPY